MPVNSIVSSPMLNAVMTTMWNALSLVWMELIMMALAVGVYLVFGGIPVAKQVNKKDVMDEDNVQRTPPQTPRRALTPRSPRTPDEAKEQLARFRACGAARDFAALRAELQAAERRGLTTLAGNCFLDACVQCGQVEHAKEQFARFVAGGLVDVVSCNTMLKALLRNNRLGEATALLRSLPNGLAPNKVTYNEMLNALVVKDRSAMWALVEEMGANGFPPSAVTCSIVLKSLASDSDAASVQRALALVDGLEEMDEVLFSSVIEACVRVGQLGLLSQQLESYARQGGLERLSAPTYGSLIKAYGKARDLERVWQLWAAMEARKLVPTAVTLGCMVDALVKNGQAAEAHDLVQRLERDPACASLANTVIYSTLLKGFTLSRQPELVEQVYGEMRARKVVVNTISFNTMIDCFARAGRMTRCEELMADLEAWGHPDVVTYSTLVKGYCMAGDLDRAFAVLRKMLDSGRHAPDEILFNSLLDGCARQQRVEEALSLVEDMHSHHVRPSNYTLSILVKLLGRSRRLSEAFRIVEQTCERFKFRANVHVYTCLLQACVQNRQLARALALHDTLVAEAVQPDAKLYSTLARGCLACGSYERLACVVRAAHGLPSSLARPRVGPGLEPAVLEEVMGALSANATAEQLAVPLLADLKAEGVHVERGTYQSAVATSVARAGHGKTFPSYKRAGRGGRGR